MLLDYLKDILGDTKRPTREANHNFHSLIYRNKYRLELEFVPWCNECNEYVECNPRCFGRSYHFYLIFLGVSM